MDVIVNSVAPYPVGAVVNCPAAPDAAVAQPQALSGAVHNAVEAPQPAAVNLQPGGERDQPPRETS